MPHNIAILGASGYTGAELVRIIATHPSFVIKALTGDRKAGLPMAAVYPHLRHLDLPDLISIDTLRADMLGNKAAFSMMGWKDVDAFCNGAEPVTRPGRWVMRHPVDSFDSYPALYQELASLIIQDAESELYGAVLTQV